METSGNDLAHTILRGGVNQYGQTIPNYHYEDLIHLSALYAKKDLKNPAIIIDANQNPTSNTRNRSVLFQKYFTAVTIIRNLKSW